MSSGTRYYYSNAQPKSFEILTTCHLLSSDQRIIVKSLEEDLYDGQILGKLVEKLRYAIEGREVV